VAKRVLAPTCIAYLVVLCFERRGLKQNTVARKSQNIWPVATFWTSYATVQCLIQTCCLRRQLQKGAPNTIKTRWSAANSSLKFFRFSILKRMWHFRERLCRFGSTLINFTQLIHKWGYASLDTVKLKECSNLLEKSFSLVHLALQHNQKGLGMLQASATLSTSYRYRTMVPNQGCGTSL